MAESFQANGLATFIGSLPLTNHEEAIDLILEHTPEFPLWTQLPGNKNEGISVQFSSGLPGFCKEQSNIFVNTESDSFDNDLLQFFEEYIAVTDGSLDLNASRFTLNEDTAWGFFVFLERLQTLSEPPVAVKGQITGPFTFCTGITDQNKRAIFYDLQLREAAVKLLAMKARWQARRLAQSQKPVIIFFDEPGLAGYGSSEFTSISHDEVNRCFEEVFEAVHSEGALAGVHICGNTDWSLVLESTADIVSFDAYAYFDRFILYPDQIKNFLDSGNILAWGIVPTMNTEDIERETSASLMDQLQNKIAKIEALGIDRPKLIKQSLITPSCGTGSLSIDLTRKVLKLTRELSQEIRSA
jgi:methionine synthase II (cobalamin-independent)